jgi:hypothetical protein
VTPEAIPGRRAISRGTDADETLALRLHSYVLDHDFGFAPNPFYGICTLATCKPKIRHGAEVGDYIVGTGCAKRKRRGYLVYFMRVDEVTTYDAYWGDPRFQRKRPVLRGSKMQAFGDNIYHKDPGAGGWLQENSFHSLHNGHPNPLNLDHDTKSDRVLIGSDYAYWGGGGPKIPETFRNFQGVDICSGRGHRNRFSDELVSTFVTWLRSLNERGYVGPPLDWPRSA